MNKEETIALQQLTGATHLNEVALEHLQQLVADYPYFATAQLLLCQKMLRDKHPGFEQQLYKTALYFPNEPWLRYLLLPTKEIHFANNILPEKEPSANIELNEPATDENKTPETITQIAAEQTIAKPTVALVDAGIKEDTASQTEPDRLIEEGKAIVPPAVEERETTFSREDIDAEPEEAPLDEEELAQQTEPLPIEASNQKIASLLSGQAEEFAKSVAADKPVAIETEPYHTVDYFASQGIKLDARKEDTGFDKKVHKFTDWLRQMKRISPKPLDLGTEAEEESQVADIAASSNLTRDVITESMAEVLEKQCKFGKAIEIYEKLSLLYPSKNAYFAAKIQQLKQ